MNDLQLHSAGRAKIAPPPRRAAIRLPARDRSVVGEVRQLTPQRLLTVCPRLRDLETAEQLLVDFTEYVERNEKDRNWAGWLSAWVDFRTSPLARRFPQEKP